MPFRDLHVDKIVIHTNLNSETERKESTDNIVFVFINR